MRSLVRYLIPQQLREKTRSVIGAEVVMAISTDSFGMGVGESLLDVARDESQSVFVPL